MKALMREKVLMTIGKKRLDQVMVDRELAPSRSRAQALIMAGRVKCGETTQVKPGMLVNPDSPIEILGTDCPYVSRGGLKLEAALNAFKIEPQGLRCIDLGASTGGFTDCLLQRGAARICAVDVGYGQLHWTLRQNERVHVLERTNARYLEADQFDHLFDLAVIDVSFISLRLIFPVAWRLLHDEGMLISLIKPQFEVGRGEVGKKGVVRDPEKHARVVAEISQTAESLGFNVKGVIESPITGPKGNKEFLLVAVKILTAV